MLRFAMLVWVSAACSMLFGLAAGAEAPPGIELLQQEFNAEEGEAGQGELSTATITTSMDPGIASYPKSKTQFDGVTSETQVTYLRLQTD